MLISSWLQFDRLLTLYCFGPLAGRVPSVRKSIPILMYHSIAADDAATVHPYYRLTTTPSVFASQMEYLHRNEYQTVSLAEAFGYLNSGGEGDRKMVAITFDDGFHDFLTDAFPILRQHGFSATVFLPTAYIGNERNNFMGRDCLVWREVKELHANGIRFGSHTVSHPMLQTLNERDIRAELENSKEAIENNLGSQIDDFSYPYAFPESNSHFRSRIVETLAECGYRHAVTTRIGTADQRDGRYLTRRVPMNSGDDTQLFEAKLSGGYNWLYTVQRVVKMIKKINPIGILDEK